MIDFNEYIELNEAFNSEPYPVEYKATGTSEKYFFEEDPTHQYRVEVNKADTSIPLGKDVRTVWITHKNAGKNYKPIIGKFKDPRRVIATVLDILNKYKQDGKYGSKAKGFAIRLNGANFGPYASFVLKVSKQYLRQQFDTHSTAVKDEQTDSAYIMVHRKGTDFDNVFSDYVEWHGSDINTSSQTSTVEPVAEPQQEEYPELSVGDIYHNVDSDTYHVITDIEDGLATTKAYYKKDNKRAMQFDMDETDPDYILDYFEPFVPTQNTAPAPVQAPAPAPAQQDDYPVLKVGDIYHQAGSRQFQVVTQIKDGLATTQAFNKSDNKRVQGADFRDEDPDFFLDYFEPYVPTGNFVPPAPVVEPTVEQEAKFKVGDYIVGDDPKPSYYFLVKAIVKNPDTGVLEYKLSEFLTYDDVVNRKNVTLKVSRIDSENYILYDPKNKQTANSKMFSPGDVVKDPSKDRFAVIIQHTASVLEFYHYPDISEDRVSKTTERKYGYIVDKNDIADKAHRWKPFYDADPIFIEAYWKVGDRLIDLSDLVEFTITGIDNVKKEYIGKNQYGMETRIPFFKGALMRGAMPGERIERTWRN